MTDWTRCEHGAWPKCCWRCNPIEPASSFTRSADGKSAVFTLLGTSFWLDFEGVDGLRVQRMEPLDVEGSEDLAGTEKREADYERGQAHRGRNPE